MASSRSKAKRPVSGRGALRGLSQRSGVSSRAKRRSPTSSFQIDLDDLEFYLRTPSPAFSLNLYPLPESRSPSLSPPLIPLPESRSPSLSPSHVALPESCSSSVSSFPSPSCIALPESRSPSCSPSPSQIPLPASPPASSSFPLNPLHALAASGSEPRPSIINSGESMLRAKVLQDLAHEKSQHEVLKLKFFEMKAQRQWLGERLDESERLLDLHDSNVEYKDTQISQLRHELAEERRRRQTTEEYTTRMETELFQASVANENLRGSEDEHRVSALKLTLQVMMKEAQIVKESFAKCRQDMANYARSIYINADDWAAFRAFFQTHQSSQEQQDDELRNMARRLGENLQLMNEAISQVFLLTNVKQSQHRLDPTSSQGALQKRSSTSVANSWRPVKRPCLSTVRDGALLGSTPNESFFFHYEKYRHPVSSTKSARNSGPRKILQEDEAELNWWQQQERQALFEDFAVAEARMGIDALHLPPSHPNPDIYNNPGWHGVGHLSFNTSPGSSDDGKDEDSAEYIPPYEERFEWGQNGIRLIREEQSLEIVQVRTGLEWLELELKSASPSALPLAWQQTILGSPRKRVQFSEKYTIAEHDDESPVPRKRQRTNEYPSSFTTYPQSALKGFLGHPEKVANHTEVANSIPPKLPTWQRDIPLLPFRSFGTQTNEEIQDPTALRYRLRSKPKVPTQSHAKHERKHRKLRRLSKSNPYLQVPKFIRKMPGAWPVSPRATTKTSSPQSHKSPSQRFKDTLTRVAPILAGTAAVAATFWGLKQLNAYDKWIDSNDLYNGSVSGSLNSRFSDVGWMEYKLTKWLGLDRTLLG